MEKCKFLIKQRRAIVILFIWLTAFRSDVLSNSPVPSENAVDVKFTIAKLNLDAFAINERNHTVAIVSPNGMIDWLLASPDDKGQLITRTYIGNAYDACVGSAPTAC